ncbi:MAG: hypothetical protein QF662_06555 [Phycisphaerae bacterium]|nr:hypothetical protein [Phycisphaerae bacterium]
MEDQPLKSDKSEHDEYIEKRARDLGLPTDPEAYQDGGLAATATACKVSEADLIASVLNSAGIPAWVDSPRSAAMLWHMQIGIRFGGIKVHVPLGRLEDAQKVLADRITQEGQDDSISQKNELTRAQDLARQAWKLVLPGVGVTIWFFPYVLYIIMQVFAIGFAVNQERLAKGHCGDLAKARKYLLIAVLVHLPLVMYYGWLLYLILGQNVL